MAYIRYSFKLSTDKSGLRLNNVHIEAADSRIFLKKFQRHASDLLENLFLTKRCVSFTLDFIRRRAKDQLQSQKRNLVLHHMNKISDQMIITFKTKLSNNIEKVLLVPFLTKEP